MTDKELRGLSRAELLELLLSQMKENEALTEQLAAARAKLEDRQIVLDRAGSIAEAALQLNGVFSAAEAAAAQYLDSVRQLSEQQDEVSQRILAQAEKRAEEIQKEAQLEADRILAQAKADAREQKQRADAYWASVSEKLEHYYKEHQGLRELLQYSLKG